MEMMLPKMKMLSLLLLQLPLCLTDPASELAEMEEIMMSLFPFAMVLNPRVGRHQLAARVAEIFDVDYKYDDRESYNNRKQARMYRPAASRRFDKKTKLYLKQRGEVTTSVKSECEEELETVEGLEFFTSVQCRQEQQRKCHTSYVTRYSSQEVERCEEQYEKHCEIFYQSEARNVTTPVCDSQGLELEESEEKKEKFECHEEVVVVTVQTPVETCLVTSRPRCEKVTEILPRLDAVEECLELPREVCRQVNRRERQVERPRIRRDCSPPSVLLSVLP